MRSAVRDEAVVGESDNLLTTGKVAAQNATLIAAREILDAYESGVFIGSINIENVTPPIEVADAFRESVSARADRDRIANSASMKPKATPRASPNCWLNRAKQGT